jgi:GLPGLI family protein
MKKTFFISFIFLIIAKNYAQTLQGTFTQQFLKGVGKETTLSQKGSKPMSFSYQYSNNKSIAKLTSQEGTSTDIIYSEKFGQTFATTREVIRPSAIIYYKDFTINKYKVLTTKDGKDVTIADNLPIQNWNLIDENKIINGFSCKKATTINTAFGSNQNIIARYCEAIPINDGPMHYHGLPGFIIEIEINDITRLTFEKLTNTKDVITIEEPRNKVQAISFDEFTSKK